MNGQLEAFLVDATEDHPEGIGLILRHVQVIEDTDGELVPSCVMTREQALKLAYALGEMAQKLPS